MNRSSELEVLFRNVSKEDEGMYEVKVTENDGKVRTFNYMLVVMGKCYSCIKRVVQRVRASYLFSRQIRPW